MTPDPAPAGSPAPASPSPPNMLPGALAYAQKLGWAVIPLHSVKDGHCTCNRAGCKNQGKHPLSHLVPHGLKDASTDPAVITHWWRESPWANIGVVTGAVSGIVVLDVDPLKGGEEALAALQETHGALPDTVMAITGSGGNHYLFQHPGPGIRVKNSVSSLGRGLDIRGDGGYIVVAPSRHVHGRRYEWELSCRPLEATLAPVPEWLLVQIREGRPAPAHPPGVGFGGVGGPLDAATVTRIRAALAYIDCEERDPWLHVGMALHSTGAGQQAYGLWCEWAQQSEKFDSKDSARVWRSFKLKNDGITLDGLFARSREAGWVDPDQQHGAELANHLLRGDIHSGDRFEMELQRANGLGPQYQTTEPPLAAPAAWTVPLLNRLDQEILARVPMRCPLAAKITTQALMAFISGRQVISQAGDPTGLYLAMAASSVGHLRPYLSLARDIMDQLGMMKAVRQQRLSNPAQIYKLLWRSPNLLHLCSEWGIILQFAKRQPAGAVEQALTLLSEVWSGKPIVMDSEDIKLPDPGVDGQYVIRAPHITILAALSHDQLATALKLSEMGRGALEQIQYWILEDDEFTEADPDTLIDAPFPSDLMDALRTLATPIKGDGNLDGLLGPDHLPSQAVATFAVPLLPFYAPLDTLPAHRTARSLLSTARQIIRREATSLAFFLHRHQPVLTADLIQSCVDSEKDRLQRLLARFSSLSSEDGNLSVYQKVLDFITAEKGKGARSSDLISGCWAYRGLSDDKRESLIKQLLSDESIVEIQPPSKPGARRKAVVYVARQFVKEAAR